MSTPAAAVEVLRCSLNARAAGLWRVMGDRLMQAAFAASSDMSSEIAGGFAEATRSVALDRIDLGIVGAVLSGRVNVCRADDLSVATGSGRWLRAFDAG